MHLEMTPTANRLVVQSVLVHAVWFPILSSGIRGVATIHCLRKHPNSVSTLDTAAIRTRTVSCTQNFSPLAWASGLDTAWAPLCCCLVCTPFHFPMVIPLLATGTHDFQLDSSVPARSNGTKSGSPSPGSTTCTAPRLRHVGEVTSYPTHTDRCLRGSLEARTPVTRHPKSPA